MKHYICLSTEPWSAQLTRTQQLMARLKDVKVLFFEPPNPKSRNHHGRQVRPNVMVYTLPHSPLLHLHTSFLIQQGEKKLSHFIQETMRHHRVRNPIFWLTAPDQWPLIEGMEREGLVFDCHKYWPEATLDDEGALAAEADVVFAASPGLVDRLSPCNSNIALVPEGVTFPLFDRAGVDVPPRLQGLSGPLLGLLSPIDRNVDLAPLLDTASTHQNWNFLLLGTVENNPLLHRLERLPNVIFGGSNSLMELPDYLGQVDVCLNLLRQDEIDSDVVPTRIYQYFATGKPVVSMLHPQQEEPFPDLIYSTHSTFAFTRLCIHALAERAPTVVEHRRTVAKGATWAARMEEVIRILESIGLY